MASASILADILCILKSIISILFLVTATIRFFEIRSIGFTSIKSTSLRIPKGKIVLSIFMVIINLSMIGYLVFLHVEHTVELWDLTFLVNVVNILAWIIGVLLLHYESRKKLVESFYAHQLFWFLNLFIESIIVSLLIVMESAFVSHLKYHLNRDGNF